MDRQNVNGLGRENMCRHLYLLAMKENCKSDLTWNVICEVRHLFQKLRLGIHINLKENYVSFMANTFFAN